MTVGNEITRLTGMPVLHNHLTIEPVLPFFAFGTPPFRRLVGGFRRRLVEEIAASDLPGLVFTFVRDFDDPEDERVVREFAEPFARRGGRVLHLELSADLAERLRRNEGADRLAAKPSKRDLAGSRRHLLEADAAHRLNSRGEYDGCRDYLVIDNTRLSPGEVARRTVDHFGLPREARPGA
ncbi:hypothetical protein FH609_006005 [Streptomyces sp. 3MP-14]|uniref:Shikimate kinase n=1 Tax=Streptomyces mimosae TaxID=2586635 RepID=A0A5N6AP27_9ACTN|nr:MULTISPECIES: hypothetical protein [Streptomyces]KAB8169826.1 hypothetical protein FH607_003685 [Streptomyces mimosae]KAB8178574.1 hypothetical protein FH609_006005 [Streptomyces sp. 3MP-14]